MSIPGLDFGGSGPLLHFAHANGYPPGTYTALLERLAARYHVLSMAARPLWPEAPDPAGLRSWTPLTEDLIRFLDERGARGIIGAGHSLGAVNTLDAALRRPDLFRALVLIDPVIFRQRLIWAWSAARWLGVGDRLHPLIAGAKRRRRAFASAEDVFARYRRAAIFRRLNDQGLRHYVAALTRPSAAGGVELAYSPEWEAAIYRHGPLNLWPRLAQLRLPVLVIYGVESDAFQEPVIGRLRRLWPHGRFAPVAEAGHLVPLEQPALVAQTMLDFLAALPPAEQG